MCREYIEQKIEKCYNKEKSGGSSHSFPASAYGECGEKTMVEIQEYIKTFAEKEDLSLKALSDRLGYKSRTSLDRILTAQATPDSVRKLERLMLNTFKMGKTDAKELHESVLVSIYGEEKYRAMKQMWVFVRGESAEQRSAVHISDAFSGEEVDLKARYANSDAPISITVVNAQYVSGLFYLLEELLHNENITVLHYLYSNDDGARTVSSVCSVMPIFYEKNYFGYTRERSSAQETGLNEADFMVVQRGSEDTDLIWLTGADRGVLMETPGTADDLPRKLGLRKEAYVPIKRTYFSCTALDDYIQYSKDYAALERGNAILKIKPDVGVDQIPTWILRQAMLEGSIPRDEAFMQLLSALEEIYQKRYEDTYAKHKSAHTIFKRSAFQKFARTGKTSDHFWAMRPYTPQERIAILQDLVRRQATNPYVHFYFLKDESVLRDVEIAYYEGVGMLILPSDTDYNLPKGHSEVLVTHPEMLALYREFFSEVLLRDFVYSTQETVRFLNELICEVAHVEEK